MENTFLGLRTTIYKVADLAEATSWYAEAFGIKPYFDEQYYVGFNVGGYELGLQPEETTVTEKPESVLTYWGVENVEEVYQKLLAAGAVSHETPTHVGGEIVVASVKAPWQNIIGIIYNPHFKLTNE